MDARNILLVDDEVGNLNALIRAFRREYNVFSATSEEDALAIMERNDIALIIASHNTSGMNGVGFLGEAARRHPDTICILLAEYDQKLFREAISMEYIHSYITIPWEPEGVIDVVKQQLHPATRQQTTGSEMPPRMRGEVVETLESRKNSRIDVNLECAVQFHQTHDTIDCVTRNISEGCTGIMVVTSDPRVCVKGDVDLFTSISANEPPVVCSGRIVWYSEAKEPFRGDTGYTAGVFIDSITWVDRRRLEHAIGHDTHSSSK